MEQLLHARSYLMITKFRHTMCPECTFGAVKQLVTLGRREGSEGYSGGQLKIFCAGLTWSQPTATKIENKNLAVKPLFFFRCLAGHQLNRDNTGHVHEFLAVRIIVTREVLATIIASPC